jgi:hypothetical protein
MGEELLGILELLALAAQLRSPPADHLAAADLVAMQHLRDLGQAHPDLLAGAQHPQAVQVLLGVVAVPGSGAVGTDRADLVPVAQHVLRHPDPCGGLGDPHAHILP